MKPKKMILAQSQGMNLSEKWTDVLRVGDWSNSYKEFEITKKDLDSMIKNFQLNVLGLDKQELQFNYSHASYKEAAGWIEDLQLNGSILQAKVRWTKKARERIEDEEYKYVSAELDLGYRDEETGTKHGATLTGAALTNIPFVRGMKAVALSNEEEISKNLYLFSKKTKMEKFKKLLSEMKGKQDLSAQDFAKTEGAFQMLSDEDQTAAKQELDSLKAKVKDESASVELAEANTKIASLEAKIENSGGVQLSDMQKALDSANSKITSLEKLGREKELSVKLDALVQSGKLLDKSRESMQKNLMGMSTEAQASMLQILDDQTPVVPVGTESGNGGEGDGADQDDVEKDNAEARELMKSDSSLSLSDALSTIYRKRSMKS